MNHKNRKKISYRVLNRKWIERNSGSGCVHYDRIKCTALRWCLFTHCFCFLHGGLLYFKNSHRKTTTFPQGLYFLEPLYAIMKSLATLLLLLFAVLETSTTAFAYFVNGIGHTMTTGPVVPYTITMFLVCMGLYFYNRHMSARLNHMSIIIQAESKGNLVDGLISGAIGLAVILLHFIPISSPLGFYITQGTFS